MTEAFTYAMDLRDNKKNDVELICSMKGMSII